jgi:methionyl-tRNA formyltransferase
MIAQRKSAIVFAYHDVGCACLQVLLQQGVDVKLLVTHTDSATENIWFGSVAQIAHAAGIKVITPDDANTPEQIAEFVALAPDFIFSFYYRNMLKPAVLAVAKHGAFNMHGSLLPKYRGRVPINWAIIHGETQTGATLHEMVEKPDAGRLAGQKAVNIGANETAQEVFVNVTKAAAELLAEVLPTLLDGTLTLTAQDLSQGSYYGGRKAADGEINWAQSALQIHNLVRAVAPPYPGASTQINGVPVIITKTSLAPPHITHKTPARVNVSSTTVIALCGDGRMVRLLGARIGETVLDELALAQYFGVGVYGLGAPL